MIRRKIWWIFIFCTILLFIFNVTTFWGLHTYRFNVPDLSNIHERLNVRLNALSESLTSQIRKQQQESASLAKLEKLLHGLRGDSATHLDLSFHIPIVVIACNRPSVQRCLDQLLQRRAAFQQIAGISSAEVKKVFPIFVSQDCQHRPTADIIQRYVAQGDVVEHMRQPDQSDIPKVKKHMKGYFKISRHFKWALDQVFLRLNFSRVLILEDDLDVGVDLLAFFRGLAPLLDRDPTLWCISAWNDNGKQGFIDTNASSLLYRSDFFPGLGWLTTRSIWLELMGSWPPAFWDDHMRTVAVRKGRQCIRPEISRTHTFGKVGVSNGQFFEAHLRHIVLYNGTAVPFHQMDLDYLLPQSYEASWKKQVYEMAKLSSIEDAVSVASSSTGSTSALRVEYQSNKQLIVFLKRLGAMDDLKAGVARTAYLGVVPLMLKGRVRVFIAPPSGTWKGYQQT